MGKRITPQEVINNITNDRLNFAIKLFKENGISHSEYDQQAKSIKVDHNGQTVTFYPYTGWFTGKSVVDGRGVKNLIKQIVDIPKLYVKVTKNRFKPDNNIDNERSACFIRDKNSNLIKRSLLNILRDSSKHEDSIIVIKVISNPNSNMSLTKTEAKELLESGNKVTHNLFMDHEYIYKKKEHPKSIFAEDGTEMDEDDFWNFRIIDSFESGWSVYDELNVPDNE